MPSHRLTNFEIQKYYQNESKFKNVYSRNNLFTVKDGIYTINLDEYKSIATHWVTLYVNVKNVTYYDSIKADHILKEIRKFIGNKNVIINIE